MAEGRRQRSLDRERERERERAREIERETEREREREREKKGARSGEIWKLKYEYERRGGDKSKGRMRREG